MEQVNPAGIKGGDRVLIESGLAGWRLCTVQWADNELGLLSLRTATGGYVLKTPLETKLIQPGFEQNKGYDKGEPTLPLNPNGVEIGDLVWTDNWGPGVVMGMKEGYLILDTEHYIPIRCVHLSTKAGDERFEQKKTVLRGVWKSLQAR